MELVELVQAISNFDLWLMEINFLKISYATVCFTNILHIDEFFKLPQQLQLPINYKKM